VDLTLLRHGDDEEEGATNDCKEKPLEKRDRTGPSTMRRKAMVVRKKILVIGDKGHTQLFSSLQEEGYEVIACDSAQKAWGLVYPFRPHFIVVHLHHPSQRDMAVLQECHAMAEGVPIIVATSVPGNEAVMKALEEGATAFLSLPMEPQSIRKVLDELEHPVNEGSAR